MATTVVSIINQKGGTGKTTTTINLGRALSKLGYKVLLVDLDPQSNLSYSLDITEPEFTLADAFAGTKKLTDILLKKDENFFVAPGSPELVDIEISLVTEEKREYFLKNILSGAKGFQYILIDCPPSLSILTLNALTASHQVLIPLQMEVLTMQGLNQILSTVNKVKSTLNARLQVKGIVIVMYDKRRKLSSEIEAFLQENLNEKIFNSRIRLNVKLAEAPSFGKSILDYDAASNGAQDYLALAKEFAE